MSNIPIVHMTSIPVCYDINQICVQVRDIPEEHQGPDGIKDMILVRVGDWPGSVKLCLSRAVAEKLRKALENPTKHPTFPDDPGYDYSSSLGDGTVVSSATPKVEP